MAVSFDTGLPNVAFRYARQNNPALSKELVDSVLQNNPYFPSLYSLQQGFEALNLKGAGYRIDKKELSLLEPPFIAYIEIKPAVKDFVLVTEMSETNLIYIYKGAKQTRVSREQFETVFRNVVWKYSETKDFYGVSLKVRLRQILQTTTQKFAAGVIAVSLIIAVFTQVNERGPVFTALLKIIGCILTGSLLAFEHNAAGSAIRQLCAVNKSTDCSAVLNSKGSGFRGVSWSETGFFYFGFGLLLTVNTEISSAAKLNILSWLSLAISPYILYSIYYQWRVVRQWCSLCLAVQIVIFTEAVVAWTNLNSEAGNVYSNIDILSVILCAVFPPALWFAFKPFVLSRLRIRNISSAYNRLKNHPAVFKALLFEQDQAPAGFEYLGIDIGNPAAENLIIKVCNPYCVPCAKSHIHLENLLKATSNTRLKIIFTVPDNPGDRRFEVVRQMLTVAADNPPEEVSKMLQYWYSSEDKPVDLIRQRYHTESAEAEQSEKLRRMHKWCREAGIHHTPTLFFNGRKLPEHYAAEELTAIVREL